VEWSYLFVWLALPCLAGYIAHRKGHSWVLGAFLTILTPPLGLLVVLLQSPHASTGQPGRAKARIFVGLLPLWIAILAVAAGSFMTKSGDYWNVAPWLIVAAIPACIVTLALVEMAARKPRAPK
jgi:hypothetical protein